MAALTIRLHQSNGAANAQQALERGTFWGDTALARLATPVSPPTQPWGGLGPMSMRQGCIQPIGEIPFPRTDYFSRLFIEPKAAARRWW